MEKLRKILKFLTVSILITGMVQIFDYSLMFYDHRVFLGVIAAIFLYKPIDKTLTKLKLFN